MKITRKTTMEQLVQFLGENSKLVKEASKELFDQMAYANKMMKKDASKVTRQDLVDIAKSVAETLGDQCIMTALAEEKPAEKTEEAPKKSTAKADAKKAEKKPTEDSLKTAKGVAKSQSKKAKAEEPKEAEEAEENTPKEASEKAEKTAKKSGKLAKKSEKKDGVTSLYRVDSNKVVQLAKQFPESITVGDTTYEIAHDIKDMKDLHKALEADEEIVFAYWWTKRHLKQFPYFSGMLGQPKSFDNDLDLATAIYVSDEDKVAYEVSMYTEAVYTTIPTDMPEEDGLRINCGMEYQIYRAKA